MVLVLLWLDTWSCEMLNKIYIYLKTSLYSIFFSRRRHNDLGRESRHLKIPTNSVIVFLGLNLKKTITLVWSTMFNWSSIMEFCFTYARVNPKQPVPTDAVIELSKISCAAFTPTIGSKLCSQNIEHCLSTSLGWACTTLCWAVNWTRLVITLETTPWKQSQGLTTGLFYQKTSDYLQSGSCLHPLAMVWQAGWTCFPDSFGYGCWAQTKRGNGSSINNHISLKLVWNYTRMK